MVKLVKTPTAIRQRIHRLPKLSIGMMEARAKKDAKAVERGFREGIQADLLHLRRLKPGTIAAKEREGMISPSTPLFGLGPEDERAYSEMMQVKKVGNRMWVVKPKPGKHHSSELTLRQLFDVHEYGCTITNGFGRGILIRIPPRSAMRTAYRGYIRQMSKLDPSMKVRTAMAKFIQNGDKAALDRIHKKYVAGGK